MLRVEIPPLRSRPQDAVSLARSFFKQCVETSGLPFRRLDKEAERVLLQYDWPGNVRELRNVVTRAALLSKTEIVSADILREAIHSKGFMLKSDSAPGHNGSKSEIEVKASASPEISGTESRESSCTTATKETNLPENRLKKCKADISDSYARMIRTALEISGGSKKQAAELIGISRRTLYRMMERYGISQ